MRIGIGSYALFWERHHTNPHPLGIAAQVERAIELDCEVFQICDDPHLDELDDAALAGLRGLADRSGLALELGTRGTDHEHLARQIAMAGALGATMLRSMVTADDLTLGLPNLVHRLGGILPLLDEHGVSLALETYEQIPTSALVHLVNGLNSPRIGICLDPANCVSALEHPRTVVELTAAHTINLHVKDFAFTRADDWVGFRFAGARLGAGMLDLDHELSMVTAAGRCGSAIVEHWVPWQGDLTATLAIERDWTQASLAGLRAWRAAHPGSLDHHRPGHRTLNPTRQEES